MKNLFALACLLIAVPSFAAPKSYVTKQNEEGLYCARVEMTTVGLTKISRTKCRTIEEWKDAGYEVTFRPVEAG